MGRPQEAGVGPSGWQTLARVSNTEPPGLPARERTRAVSVFRTSAQGMDRAPGGLCPSVWCAQDVREPGREGRTRVPAGHGVRATAAGAACAWPSHSLRKAALEGRAPRGLLPIPRMRRARLQVGPVSFWGRCTLMMGNVQGGWPGRRGLELGPGKPCTCHWVRGQRDRGSWMWIPRGGAYGLR